MRLTDKANIRRMPLFDVTSGLALVKRLVRLRDCWTRRGPGFFTLGAAAYLDIARGGDYAQYSNRFGRSNPVIRENFGALASTLAECLGEMLGEHCAFSCNLALPGFHIFEHEGLHDALRDNLHLDLQHSLLPMGFPIETPSLTFTLPLEMPVSGGGLEICDIVQGNPRGRLAQYEYRIGELFVHTGRTLHRRVHRATTTACRRITLQGHAIRRNQIWILYW